MDNTSLLKVLGEETLYLENIYLNLKIEKALEGDNFSRENLLDEAENLWRQAETEYRGFLQYLLDHHIQAA
jgi:hypothetical protein